MAVSRRVRAARHAYRALSKPACCGDLPIPELSSCSGFYETPVSKTSSVETVMHPGANGA
jgi:hypothetical protein